MKQTRQAVRAIKQSIYIDVYGSNKYCGYEVKGTDSKNTVAYCSIKKFHDTCPRKHLIYG